MKYPDYNRIVNRFCLRAAKITSPLLHLTEGALIDYTHSYHKVYRIKRLAENALVELENLDEERKE